MSTDTQTKTAKSETVYENVKMTDGREVAFAGKRQLMKDVTPSADGTSVVVRFDLRNGKTYSIDSAKLDAATVALALGHGLSQKIGDTTAGTPEVEDMALAIEDMIDRLGKGEWGATREAGDGFSGAGIVIQAMATVTGKPVADIKAFFNAKLEAAKAAGTKLSRKDLYDSLRNPASKVGQEIKRLEDEKRTKSAKLSADDLVAELG